MSTFFVLPPRALLGDHLADLLQGLLPGTDWDVSARRELADRLVEQALVRRDVYAVHREDLPAGEPLSAALVHGYGAQKGDEVVEVRPSVRPGGWCSRRWRIEGAGPLTEGSGVA